MAKKKVLFIINPISGGKNKDKIPALIENTLDKNQFDITITFTKAPGHARELAAQPGFDYYIAVGGDGTLNEVASQLINTEACMGILPMGSGNGLARHMGINMNIEKAILQINTAKIVKIDTCTVNGKPFINMAGVGFDAHIGKLFAESTGRGFKTYVVQTLTEFKNYQSQKYKINYGGKEIVSDAFLLSFANSSQYGNNAYIAPDADIKDGMLDICLMKPFKVMDVLSIGFRLFNKTIKQSKYLQTIQAKEFTVTREQEGVAHLDGEPMIFGKQLDIKVLSASLKLLVP
ncbi:MAG: diacylglycerol kinase family lipid kinase [Opitutaceae bacterium]|nr:diacylglycerol kinase family lipid kinase [Cytophagales bacterium]